MNIPIISAVKKQRDDMRSRKQFEQSLIGEMDIIISRLDEIRETFNLVCDDELIEAIIYEEMSLKSHYAYLLRIAKENNIKYSPAKSVNQ